MACVLLVTSGCQPHEQPGWTGAAASSDSPSPVPSPVVTVDSSSEFILSDVDVTIVPTVPQGLPTHLTVVNPDGGVVIDANMIGEGFDSNGDVNPNQTPGSDGLASWVNEGSRSLTPPGHPGSAIIAGHASTHGGVFGNLPATQVGAVITVRYSTGDEVKFVARRVIKDLKTAVTDVDTTLGRQIWGDAAETLTWLITCNTATELVDGHYLGNVVVEAALQ